MSEFQRFQTEQERLKRKIEAAVAAQRKRERSVDMDHKRLLWIGGACVLLAVLGIFWLSGWRP